jgi:flavin reductase (DIM6/NTAB) family NADH-FMN oxidoreductase RutF
MYKKVKWPGGAMIAPVPAVLVTSGNKEKSNVMTVAWTGIINSHPAMTYVSIRPERHSHKLISESGEFVINLVSRDMVRKTDQCGVFSGAHCDKFKKFNLSAEKAFNLNAPVIKESPVALECKVEKVISLGSHDMFLAKIVSVNIEEDLIRDDGKLDLGKAKLVAYSHGDYLEL